jgi:hypothetical protein
MAGLNYAKVIPRVILAIGIIALGIWIGPPLWALLVILVPGLRFGKDVSGNGSPAKSVDQGLKASTVGLTDLAKSESATQGTISLAEHGVEQQARVNQSATDAVADGLKVLQGIADSKPSN